MALAYVTNVATTATNLTIDIQVGELYIGGDREVITMPYTLLFKNAQGETVKSLTTVGMDSGQAYQDWAASPIGQAILAALPQVVQAHLANPDSALRKELDSFATLNT